MQEIVMEPVSIDQNGIPQYERAKERQPNSSVIGLIVAYGLFFCSIAISGI